MPFFLDLFRDAEIYIYFVILPESVYYVRTVWNFEP
jgi:hypothetical protein